MRGISGKELPTADLVSDLLDDVLRPINDGFPRTGFPVWIARLQQRAAAIRRRQEDERLRAARRAA